MTGDTRRRIASLLSLALFLATVILFTVLFWDSLTATVSDPEAFRQRIEGYGIVGQIIFVLLMAAQVVLAIIPGQPFQIAGGYCFGILGGTLLVSLGALIGSAAAFLLSRIFGLRAVKSFYSDQKLQKLFFLRASEKQNFFAFIVFLIPGIPKDMIAYFMGVTEMRLPTFLLISTLARLPGIFISVLGGAVVQTRSTLITVLFFVFFFLTLAISLLLYFLKKRELQKKQDKENEIKKP